MRKIAVTSLSGAACFFACASALHAQNATRALVVSACGNQAFPIGTAVLPVYEPFTILQTGVLCTTAGSGGGGSITQGTSPWVDNISQWAGTALGAPSNYGTAPTGVVPGVNAFVSNFPTTQQVNGSVSASQGSPAAVTNAWPAYLAQGGAALSSTNGLPTTDTNAANTITSPGIAATKAQAIQGVAGGTAVPVTGTFFQSTQPVSTADGAQTTLGSKADTAAGTGSVTAMAVFKQLHLDLIGPNYAAVTTSAPSYTSGTTQAMSLNTAGGLRVDGSGTTQPISGTVTDNQGAPAAVANAWPFYLTQGGSALNTTSNGLPTAINAPYIASGLSLSNGQYYTLNLDALAALRVTESAASLATSQATATTTAGVICAARTGRRSVTIQNLGTTPVFYGASSVTSTTGGLIPGSAGSAVTLNTSAAIYGVTSTGSQTVACTETY